MRDPLWRCDEHRGPDADFPALRGSREPRRYGAGGGTAAGRSPALAAQSWKAYVGEEVPVAR
jgi:hypothetical protein